jgi:hypothetical protein
MFKNICDQLNLDVSVGLLLTTQVFRKAACFREGQILLP